MLSPAFSAVKTYELLHRMTGEGLSVEYYFSRQPFTPDSRMVAVQIQILNNTAAEVKNIHVNEPKLLSGMRVQEFKEIGRTCVCTLMCIGLWSSWLGCCQTRLRDSSDSNAIIQILVGLGNAWECYNTTPLVTSVELPLRTYFLPR